MIDDLRTTHFNDGTLILPSDGEFDTLTSSYTYDFDLAYNSNNICPIGYHIPSRQDWYNLFSFFSTISYSTSTYCQNQPITPNVNNYNNHHDLLSNGWQNYYPNNSCFNVELNSYNSTSMKYFSSDQALSSCFVFTNNPSYNQSTSTFYIEINENYIGTGYDYTSSGSIPYKFCVRCIKD
jgi:uncharacterized protein (TIGR02145 family)